MIVIGLFVRGGKALFSGPFKKIQSIGGIPELFARSAWANVDIAKVDENGEYFITLEDGNLMAQAVT